jgi:Purple acid Phosphatase, N-terminal domain
VHVQYGADAATQAAVSWQTAARVSRPRLRVGKTDVGFGHEVPAEERPYTEALTGQVVWTYHARLDGLQPDTQYVFATTNDGAPAAVPAHSAPAPAAGLAASGSPASGTRRCRSRSGRAWALGP